MKIQIDFGKPYHVARHKDKIPPCALGQMNACNCPLSSAWQCGASDRVLESGNMVLHIGQISYRQNLQKKGSMVPFVRKERSLVGCCMNRIVV